ncbi:MAG: hypothetical protein GY856_08960 [bacterium]|nr:hypothetical protein [bacterium]
MSDSRKARERLQKNLRAVDAARRFGLLLLGLGTLLAAGCRGDDAQLGTAAEKPSTIDEELARAGDPYPLDQTNQLFRNLGDGTFAEVTGAGGKVFELKEVSRGAAFGDIDNDGDNDAVISNSNGPARLLLNQLGNRRRWLGLRLVGERFPRDMLGTRVRILRSDGRELWRRVHTDGSYCSANDPRILVGLGDSPAAPSVRAYWPDGTIEEWPEIETGRYVTLGQGSGRIISNP